MPSCWESPNRRFAAASVRQAVLGPLLGSDSSQPVLTRHSGWNRALGGVPVVRRPVHQVNADPQDDRVPAAIVPDEIALPEVEVEDRTLPFAVPCAGMDADRLPGINGTGKRRHVVLTRLRAP